MMTVCALAAALGLAAASSNWDYEWVATSRSAEHDSQLRLALEYHGINSITFGSRGYHLQVHSRDKQTARYILEVATRSTGIRSQISMDPYLPLPRPIYMYKRNTEMLKIE